MSFPPCPPVGSESGYDTASSFYSSTPTGDQAGMMSPVPQHYDPSCNSPVSEYQYHQQQHSYYPPQTKIESNSYEDYSQTHPEEDELLDVIAKWQES